MWPKSSLTSLLGSLHPILQAPMAGAASPELAAAVSAAGGVGGYGAAGTEPDELREVIRSIRSVTDAPFNINLFTPVAGDAEPNPGGEAEIRRALEPIHQDAGAGRVPFPVPLFGNFEEKVEVVLEEQVPIVSVHFGIAARHLMIRLAEASCKVISTATTVEEAEILESSGANAIIAQGLEAGGHQGTFRRAVTTRLSTMTLLPSIVDSVRVPVIAAGGISDGRGIAAALALGASGVQMGTAFLACTENDIHREYRRALLAATGEDTVLTTAISGRPARGLRNQLVDLLEPLDRLRYPEHYSLTRKLRQAANRESNGEFMAMWSGMGVGQLQDSQSAGTVVQRLVAETRTALGGLSPEAGRIEDAETTEVRFDS